MFRSPPFPQIFRFSKAALAGEFLTRSIESKTRLETPRRCPPAILLVPKICAPRRVRFIVQTLEKRESQAAYTAGHAVQAKPLMLVCFKSAMPRACLALGEIKHIFETRETP
jgi:hypothetical protein